jgi:hypothetical protein
MSSSQKGLSFRESHYDDDSSTNNTTTPLPSVPVDVASDNAHWMLLVAGCKFDQSYDTTETCCDDTVSSYDDLSEGHGDDDIYEMLVSSIPPLLRVGGVAVGAGDEDYQLEYPGMQYWEETLEHYQPFREPPALAGFSSFEDDLSVDSLLVHIRRQQSRRVVAPSADKEACSSQGKQSSEEDDEAHDASQYPDHSSVESCTETLRSEDACADHEKQSETRRTRRSLVPPLSPGVVAQQEESLSRRRSLRRTNSTDSVDSLTRVTIARRRRQRRTDRRSSE